MGTKPVSGGLDEISYRLIVELQKSPRRQASALAKSIGVSAGVIHRRIEKLVTSGVIDLTAIPNPAAFGFPVHAFIELQIRAPEVTSVAESLSGLGELHYASICAGPSDIFAWGFFASMEHLSWFVDRKLGTIPGIIQVETTLGLRQVKRTHGWLDGQREPGTTGTAPMPTQACTVDRTMCELIIELQADPRRSNRELGKIVGLSGESVRRRIARLEESGMVRLTAVPDQIMIGNTARAYVPIEVEVSNVALAAEAAARFPQVHYVYICSGRNRVLVGVLESSLPQLSHFIRCDLSQIPGVIRTKPLIDMENFKRTLGRMERDAIPTYMDRLKRKVPPERSPSDRNGGPARRVTAIEEGDGRWTRDPDS